MRVLTSLLLNFFKTSDNDEFLIRMSWRLYVPIINDVLALRTREKTFLKSSNFLNEINCNLSERIKFSPSSFLTIIIKLNQ